MVWGVLARLFCCIAVFWWGGGRQFKGLATRGRWWINSGMDQFFNGVQIPTLCVVLCIDLEWQFCSAWWYSMVVEETSCMATKAARRARRAAAAAAATAATAAATTGSAKDQYCSASVASLWPISIVLLYVAFLDLGLVGVCCAMVCNGITDRVGGGSMGFDVGRFVFSLPLVRWDEAIQRGGQLVEIVLNMERFRKPFITSTYV